MKEKCKTEQPTMQVRRCGEKEIKFDAKSDTMIKKVAPGEEGNLLYVISY